MKIASASVLAQLGLLTSGISLFCGFGEVLSLGRPTISTQGQAVGSTETPKLESRKCIAASQHYQEMINKTIAMVSDPHIQSLVQQFGLDILNLAWEDTSRYKSSAVGLNISDMTVQVQHQDAKTRAYKLSLMPVIRYPNFSDKSADVRLDQLFLLVGNQKGEPLQRVSLKNFLGDPRRYLSKPNSWKGQQKSLLAKRDSHVLVSAQACFLPVPQGRKAEFNPVLFNYQSIAGDPAVLTILATREGTSVTVIDNKRDAFAAGPTWGQRLFFNQNGDRASLTGQRMSDFQTNRKDSTQEPSVRAAQESDLNMVLLIQVPLKQQQPMLRHTAAYESSLPMSAAAAPSNVEAAVIGHGKVEGPFTEIDDLEIERDTRFPIRATVQFYKATSNGIVSKPDIQAIQQQIARVYADADYVGSLVTEAETDRPAESEGTKQEPPNWWRNFWQQHKTNTGQSREDAWEMRRKLKG
ncbi:FIG00564435: hypothetical protein [uncultured Synechococcales cyanobacterium]|uniref:Uncharacterized protein n=1 Tax=uncultured Synechococcales cyanobacterium TaxID=1936017 RepID=A0A6J4VMI4_9CYAN|nr:FIG00564435: hypothetical protein [uncultured Synechococcales cyanobacterium]